MSINKKKLWLRRINWYLCLTRNPCINDDVFWRLWNSIAHDKHKRTWRKEE